VSKGSINDGLRSLGLAPQKPPHKPTWRDWIPHGWQSWVMVAYLVTASGGIICVFILPWLGK
jgi:hypothetical protein